LSRSLLTCFGLDQNPHDVAFLHDQVLIVIDLHLGAGPLAEQHQIAGFDIDRNELADLITSTGANGNNFALLGLFLGGVGNDDASSTLCLGFDAFDYDTIVKRTEFHVSLLRMEIGQIFSLAEALIP
jgi:hypothetical protein